MCHFNIRLNINLLDKIFFYYCSNTNNGCAVLGGAPSKSPPVGEILVFVGRLLKAIPTGEGWEGLIRFAGSSLDWSARL